MKFIIFFFTAYMIFFGSFVFSLQAASLKGHLFYNTDTKTFYYINENSEKVLLPLQAKKKKELLKKFTKIISSKELSSIPIFSIRKKIHKNKDCSTLRGKWVRTKNSSIIWYIDPVKCQRAFFDGTAARWNYFFLNIVKKVHTQELSAIPTFSSSSPTSHIVQNTPHLTIQPPIVLRPSTPTSSTPSIKIAQQPTSSTVIISEQPTALTLFPIVHEPNISSEQKIQLSVGQIYKLSDTVLLRLDKIDSSSEHLTFWKKDTNGCRFIYDWVTSYKSGNQGQRYMFIFQWFFRLDEVHENELTLTLMRGDKAYETCVASPVQKARCSAFKPSNSLTIFSTNFSRNFFNQDEYPFNNLMLNYSEKTFDKLRVLFPSLISAKAPLDYWKFASRQISSTNGSADSAWSDTINITPWIDYLSHTSQNENNIVNTFAKKLAQNDFLFNLSTEVHEWTHLLLFSTELGFLPSSDGESTLLAEGIAEYLSDVAKYYPNQKGPKRVFCEEDRFSGGNLKGMTYAEAFRNGYLYDAGNCFFSKVEDICGIKTINSMLQQLLQHPYERSAEYPSMFGILKNNCSHTDRFPQLMTDFGFSLTLLNQKYSLAPYTPIQENACF